MMEKMRFASELAESLALAVRTTEHLENPAPLTGLSQFTAHTIELRNSIADNSVVATVEVLVDSEAETVESVSANTGSIELVDSISETIELEDTLTEEVLEDTAAETIELEDTLVEEVLEDTVAETVELEDTLAEEVLEDTVAETIEVEDATTEEILEDPVAETIEVEDYDSLLGSEETANVEELEEVISDEEWAANEFNAGIIEVDYVTDLSLDDVWESIVEPEAEDAVVPLEAMKEKDQVVLVVDQLVVSPQQGTTIIGADGQSAEMSGPVRPVQYAQPVQGPVVYQPAPQQPQVMMPPVVGQAPVAPMPAAPMPPAAYTQQPQVYQPPVYNPPAEVSVSVSAPAAPAQPQYIDNVSVPQQASEAPVREYNENEIPVYEAPATEEKHIPHEVAEKLRDPDQVIEIRSDATSISANTVSVSSSSTPLPSLVNFDPRKYFNPNEIVPPKIEATINVVQGETPKNPYAGDLSEPAARIDSQSRQEALISSPESLSAVVLPEDEPIVNLLQDGIAGDAASRITQMFGELRRFRDK